MRTETVSATAIREGIEALRHMTVGQLKQKYREVFDEASRSNHKQFLFRRIAWRMQANAWGGLSERARRRALEIANDADLRIRAPRNFLKVELDESRTIETRVAPTEDPRLPIPGTMLVRRYRGKDIVVRVREDGFEYGGNIHRSLNGKSTYLRGVLAFMGKRNIANVSLHKLENDRFSVARLIGRLANICPDLPSTNLASTSVFKAITGGDPLMAEYKFKDSFEFVPYSRLVFSANHPPKSQDASPAFFRRWLVVPFERTFADGAPGTIPGDKLDAMLSDPAELSGVLNKALEAVAAIRKRGLSESDSTSHATDEFRQAIDPLAVWLDRKTILHPDAVTPQDQLYREYCRNCTDAGRPTTSKTAFGRSMKKLRPTVTDYQRTVNGVLAWCYVGISLVADEGN